MINKKHTYEDENTLIEDLKDGKDRAYEFVYRQYYRMTAQFVQTNRGSSDDAQDVFQEALIILIKNLKQDNFKLTAKVSTFLMAIVRRYWLYKLRGKKESSVEIENLNTDHLIEDDSGVLNAIAYDVKHTVIGTVLQQMKEDCRELLTRYYFHKSPLGDIAKQLGWTDDFVKVKKRRCMEALKNLVQQNQDYQSLLNS